MKLLAVISGSCNNSAMIATVQTLRDGLYSVSWKVQSASLRGRFSRPDPVTFDLPNYTGRISYKLSINLYETLDFDLDLVVKKDDGSSEETHPPASRRRPLLPDVFAGKDGFRQPMIPVPSPVGPYWTAGTAGTYWKTCWPTKASESADDSHSHSSRAGHKKPAVAFDLLIDFGSNRSPIGRHLITDGQKTVLDHMAKLQEDQSLADVIFKFQSKESRLYIGKSVCKKFRCSRL